MAGRSFNIIGIHLGSGGNVRKFNETTLNNGGSGPWLGQLGQIFETGGCLFRLVKVDASDVATIDGGVMYWKDKANFVVTADSSDGEGGAAEVAGGCHMVAADTTYIFVQCGGDQKAVVVAGSTVASDLMTGHASTDNVLTRTAAGSGAPDKLVAIALSTRGTTTSDNGAAVSNSSKVRWITGALL